MILKLGEVKTVTLLLLIILFPGNKVLFITIILKNNGFYMMEKLLESREKNLQMELGFLYRIVERGKLLKVIDKKVIREKYLTELR